MSAIEVTQVLTPELLDLMEHEQGVERGLAEIGWHLKQIRDGRKCRAAGFATFEDYCQERWGFGRQYVNRQIAASDTIAAIEPVVPIGTTLPVRESQVRPLTSLQPEQAATAWTEAVEQAGGGQPTAAEVQSAVERTRTPRPVPKPAPKVNGERVEGAPPHPAVYSDAVLAAFRDLLAEHHDGDPGGATILDPFAGTGRIHELQADGWHTLGVELEAEWATLHADTIHGDSRHLGNAVYDAVQCEVVDVIATSPAYGNRLADGHYNAIDPEARRSYALDLGRPLTDGSGAGLQWGTEYRSLHEAVWSECYDLLAPGGLFLLNCKDHQRDGAIVDVTWWHVRALVNLGLVVIDGRTIPPAGLALTSAAKLPELVVAFRKPVTS